MTDDTEDDDTGYDTIRYDRRD